MDREALSELERAAVRSAFHGEENDAIAGISRALASATDSATRCELLLDRAVAQQIDNDPHPSARDALAAVEAAEAVGQDDRIAAAAAVAAGFVLRTGDLDRSVDLAVRALVILSETPPASAPASVMRAFNALSVFFSRLAAFELAVHSARLAWDVADGHDFDPSTRSIVAYNVCSCALERLRAPDCDTAEVTDLVTAIHQSIAYLSSDEPSETASRVVAPTMAAELALLGLGDPMAISTLQALDTATIDAPPQMWAWHLLVRSLVASRADELQLALELVDEALVTLALPASEEHNLLRAMRHRADLRRRLGDFEGAADDLEAVVERLHRAQVDQVGRMSAQIRHRADSEIARTRVRREASVLAEQMALDEVTGVGSRRWLSRMVDELTSGGGSGALIMLDLDHFKAINDTFGHRTGDEVLSRVGSVLQSTSRSGDIVARFGGEEFILILPNGTIEEATTRAERITDRLRTLDWTDLDPALHLTASAGIAAGEFEHTSLLFELADQRLYIAKSEGRDRVVGVPGPLQATRRATSPSGAVSSDAVFSEAVSSDAVSSDSVSPLA